MKDLFVSVVLPVYNQADHIEEIAQEFINELQRAPIKYELLLVINGSSDNSLEVCQALEEKHSSLRVSYCEKSGWGSAVKFGLAQAKGDILCYTNVARTSAKDLLLFLLYAVANPEIVIKANRKIRDSKVRRIGSLIYNIECRSLFDLAYWDINGTPKVFPRKFKELLTLKRDDDLIDLEFNVACKENEYPLLEIPIFSYKRHGGRSTTSFSSALRLYVGAFSLWKLFKKNNKKHENKS